MREIGEDCTFLTTSDVTRHTDFRRQCQEFYLNLLDFEALSERLILSRFGVGSRRTDGQKTKRKCDWQMVLASILESCTTPESLH